MRKIAARTTAAAAILALALPAAAQAHGGPQRYVDPVFGGVELEADVPYGQAVNNEGELQELALDIHRPLGDTATDRPAIVFAHGGGFRNGTRKHEGAVPIVQEWAKRGYVAISISYRLRRPGTPGARSDAELVAEALTGDSPTIRDAQHDMQAAVRWTRANAASLGVDPDRIVAAGESAGAIAAWEAGINASDPGTSGTPGVDSSVAAVVSLWGAADPDHIEGDSPPVIDFHGGADTTVPLAFGAQACAITRALGATCDMVVWPTERHAAFARRDEIATRSGEFLCREVVAGCDAHGSALPVQVAP